MGNDLSTAPYQGPTEVLQARNIAAVAKYIKSDACRNIFVMNGAGVSTSAGIPDFRSPKTGLYHNLERLNLPYPEAVFEINFFRENPVPFYTLARELMPGKYRPTPTHSFVKLLHKRKLLRMCYTQNIDTLERLAGLPDEAIVEAHGSFADQHCIECGSWYDEHKLRDEILRGEVAHCYVCGGLVKPDIVFFGEALPQRFHKTIGLLRSADLLIIMGTSLKVHPFASLTQLVPEGCPRVLINLDPAGDIGSRPDDVLLLGKTDDVVRQLCQELGKDWVKELDALWKETEKYGHVEGAEAELKAKLPAPEEAKKPAAAVAKEKASVEEKAADQLQKEVEKLAAEIETALHIGKVPPPEDEPTSAQSEPTKDDTSEREGETSVEIEVEAEVETVVVEAEVETKVGEGEAEKAEVETKVEEGEAEKAETEGATKKQENVPAANSEPAQSQIPNGDKQEEHAKEKDEEKAEPSAATDSAEKPVEGKL